MVSIRMLPSVLVVFGAAASAQAPEVSVAGADNTFGIWVGYGDSDNIGRTVIAESGSYRSVGLLAGLDRESTRLDGSINADIEYRDYSIDGLDEETVGFLDAQARVDMIPDRFFWTFLENIDQGQQDPSAAFGPGNRETISVFTHGPGLDIPFGRTSLEMSATRSRRQYDESTSFDNESDEYELSLSRQRSRTASYALVVNSTETRYDDHVTPSYEIERLFLRIATTQSGGTLTAQLGTNEIQSGVQSRNDPLLRFDWNRALSARSSLGVSASREFTDTGNNISSGNVFVTTAPFELEQIGINYTLTSPRTRLSLRFNVGEEDYAGGSGLDNEFDSADLALGYSATQRLELGLRYNRYDRDYGSGVSGQDDRTFGIWLNRALGRKFGLALSVSRFEGSGNQAVEETRSELRLNYSPSGAASGTLRSMGR